MNQCVCRSGLGKMLGTRSLVSWPLPLTHCELVPKKRTRSPDLPSHHVLGPTARSMLPRSLAHCSSSRRGCLQLANDDVMRMRGAYLEPRGAADAFP